MIMSNEHHVIAILTAAMSRNYVCKGCNKACRHVATHACDQKCGDCTASPPCAFSHFRILCFECNRHFRSRTCYDNHKQRTLNKKSVCERKCCCATCGWVVTHGKHECNKRFYDNCKNKEIGLLCYIVPLKDALPPASEKVLYVFYDFESTQNAEYTDEAKLHVRNIVCVQQFCSRSEDVEDGGECVRCGKRKPSFWKDFVGDLLSYLTELHPWANKIVAIAHRTKALDINFILNRVIQLKLEPEITMNGPIFDNRHVFEKHCQDDVTVLREACRVFRREFMHIRNIQVFLESITNASACNKMLCKRLF